MTNFEVIVTAIGSPAVLAILSSYLTNRARRKEKVEDWKRQDEVADRVKEAATLVQEVAKTAAETTTDTNGKLDELKKGQKQIHTLVNSNLTASMRRELDATVRELAGMNELVAVKRKLGDEPSEATLTTIKVTEETIRELTATLNDRNTQTLIADRNLKVND
jgi:hypothetical protein